MSDRQRLYEIERVLDRTAVWERPVYRADRQRLNRERSRILRRLSNARHGRLGAAIDRILAELDREAG